MKKLFTLVFLTVCASLGTIMAQDKTTMLEVHDFTGFNNGTSITWGEQSGDDLNTTWDRVTLESIGGRNYYSWIDGKPRFSVGRASDWQYWDNGWQMSYGTVKSFFINRLDAGDKVTIEYRTDQTLHMKSGNTSLAQDNQIISGQEFTINSAGGVEIECSNQWAVIYRVTIATKHLATYVIDHQTYTFTSGGVLPDKRKAVPYITMTFGNENMDYAYVRYYGEENGVKQFGSFMLTETMDDTYFKDYFNGQDYYQNENNWNNANGPYVLKEPVVFKGGNFAEYVPWHGTYYYFYPETNGKLYVHMHSDPVTAAPLGSNDVMFLWDKTSNDGNDASSFDYNTEGFYKFGSNPQNGVRVKKNHVYFMCTTPNDPRRRNVAHLTDYTFVPDFTMTPLYKVIENGYEPQTSGEIAVSDLMYTDNNPNLHYRVKKCLGNIESAEVEIKNNKLYFTNITYKSGDKVNKGGSVIVDVDCTDGQADFVLTVPYSAEPSDNSGKQVQTWDFYNNILDDEVVGYNYDESWEPFKQANEPLDGKQHLGQHSNKESSGLYYETDIKVPAEWLNTYIDLENSKEPIFKNVYDMEGDNADMIWDTNGLIIHAHSGTTGFNNENDLPTSGFSDRFLGFMPGSKLVIPGLKANDRVVIKMGCYGNADETVENTNAILKLTNAKDAVGTDISDDYIIGGSMPYPDEAGDAKTQPHGEYHFIVANNSTSEENDFSIEVAEGTDLLKIYSITIYTNDDIKTENELVGDVAEVTFTDDDASDAEKTLDAHVRYHGYQEKSDFDSVDQLRGNLAITEDNVTVTTSDEEPYCTISTIVKKGDFGSFLAKMEVLTKDANNTYVTDYVPGGLAVGLLEKVKDGYPYTWDFTDLLKLEYNNSTYIHDAIDFEKTATNLLSDYKGWELYNGESLRNAPKDASGFLFADGGQLYAKNVMFEETAGIGFKRSTDNVEDAKLLNRSVRIRDGALVLNCNEEGKFHKMVLPKVDADAVIYVRATPIENAKLKAQCSKDGVTGADFDKTLTVGDDKVFIMKNNAEQNIELWLNGYEIHKIGVSRDFKKIGATGYATESRDHIIDHTLTEFFTGLPIKAYYGKLSDDKKSVSLEEVEFLEAAENEGDATGCILHNETTNSTKSVNVIDNGFHLFVPDMHDNGTSSINGNVLLAHLSSGNVMNGEGITRYVLTNKWYSTGDDGKQDVNTDPMKVRFVKVDHSTGARLSANSAYMELSKDAGAKIANIVLFYDEKEEPSGETTGIVTLESDNNENAAWYTLSGMRIEAPAKAGMYIRNGKKVVVRMK